jgi:hypothetical protein
MFPTQEQLDIIEKEVNRKTPSQLAEYLGEDYMRETVKDHILSQGNSTKALNELLAVGKFYVSKDTIYLWRVVFETEDGRQFSEDAVGIEIPESAALQIDEELKDQNVKVNWPN